MNKKNIAQVSISLVTTCKGRLRYLKKALPSWLKLDYDNYDIIIVDYDDPDGTEEYIKKNKKDLLKNSKAKNIKVVKVKNKPYFNLNDARNRGIDASDSELIFMIDSDIIIRRKTLLKKINYEFKNRGIIFFSNHYFLPTEYCEVMRLMYSFFGVSSLSIPFIVFVGTYSASMGGTSCFLKKYYKEVNKFYVKINKKGHGYDDVEFYVRYINGVFYNDYYKNNNIKLSSNDIYSSMKKFMKLIEVFDENIFHDIENAKEEKFRFYPEDIHASGEYNKKFVRELIEKPHLKMAIPKKILSYFEKRELINDCKKIFVKDKIEFIDDNRLIVSFLKYLGTYLFDKGYLTESEKYFKILLKKQKFLNEEDIKKIMYHLFGIEKIQQKSVFYGKKLLELILDKKRKTFEEKLIISDVFATLDDNKSSYKWLKKALNSKKNLSIYEINKYYTLLFIICIKLKKKYCKSHINKAIKLMIASVENKDHRYFTVIGSLYKKIKKYDKAIEVFKLALRKIEPHKKIFANDILLIYFNLGELFEKQGKKLYLEFYKKAIDLLKFKKGKTDIDIYRIASLFKKTGELNKSTKWFNRLLKKPIKPSLKAGVFFHLAEIYYLQNKTDKSLDYFKKCLSMNPNHIKAKNYVMKIESAK